MILQNEEICNSLFTVIPCSKLYFNKSSIINQKIARGSANSRELSTTYVTVYVTPMPDTSVVGSSLLSKISGQLGLNHSRPHSRALARETKGSGDKGFPVLDSRTSGLHVCSRDVSIYCMGEAWRLLLPLKISFFQTANQKNSN